MGISLETALGLMDDCAARGIRGRALTLGKQDVDFTLQQLLVALVRRGRVRMEGDSFMVTDPRQRATIEEFQAAGRTLSAKPAHAAAGKVSDAFFFRFMGFDEIVSVDGNAYEHADSVFDLNRTGLANAVGTFDFVYDGGTMEHVFHVPNVLRNIFETLNVGGTVLHQSPTNNYVDHGFYQFSPTLFYDYYHANEFENIEVRLSRAQGNLGMSMRYNGDSLSMVPPGSLDAAIYGTNCFAKKGSASTCDRIPQQGRYKGHWTESPASR